MTTISRYKPTLKYKIPFEKEEGIFTKLKYGSRETKIRLMTGSSPEEVLYTLRTFENKAQDISLPANQTISKFVTCLGAQARERWKKLETARGGRPFQPDEWDDAKEEWIKYYVRDTHAKETVIAAWSSSRDYLKPRETSIEEHIDRIKKNCRYLDMLPGARGVLTDLERKSLLCLALP